MLKKLMVISILSWSCSAAAMAEAGCDKVCVLGQALMNQSAPVDKMGIRTGELVFSGNQILIQALVYGEQSDAAYRAIMRNPEQNAAAQRLTKEETIRGVCASPQFREFIEAGGSFRHEIRLERDGVIFYQSVLHECPGA